MDKAMVADLREGEAVCSFFLAKQIQLRQRRRGEPFLTLTLADRTGEIAAVMWDGAAEAVQGLEDGDVLKVQGTVGEYQRERQLSITRLRKALPTEAALEDYLPRSEKDPQLLLGELKLAVDQLRSAPLRQLLTGLL